MADCIDRLCPRLCHRLRDCATLTLAPSLAVTFTATLLALTSAPHTQSYPSSSANTTTTTTTAPPPPPPPLPPQPTNTHHFGPVSRIYSYSGMARARVPHEFLTTCTALCQKPTPMAAPGVAPGVAATADTAATGSPTPVTPATGIVTPFEPATTDFATFHSVFLAWA